MYTEAQAVAEALGLGNQRSGRLRCGSPTRSSAACRSSPWIISLARSARRIRSSSTASSRGRPWRGDARRTPCGSRRTRATASRASPGYGPMPWTCGRASPRPGTSCSGRTSSSKATGPSTSRWPPERGPTWSTRCWGGSKFKIAILTAQVLDRVLEAFRIGDPDGKFPIYDPTGSVLYPGRWNLPRSPMVYAAEHYSTALLEKLVHGNGRIPGNQHFIRITIPNGVSYEILNTASLRGWDDPLGSVSREPRTCLAWGPALGDPHRALGGRAPRPQRAHQPRSPGRPRNNPQPARTDLVGRAAVRALTRERRAARPPSPHPSSCRRHRAVTRLSRQRHPGAARVTGERDGCRPPVAALRPLQTRISDDLTAHDGPAPDGGFVHHGARAIRFRNCQVHFRQPRPGLPRDPGGHAVLPAQSFVMPPADAPADLKISGKFTTGKRVEAMASVEGTSGDRPTGVKLPFRGQPLQGHSGIKHMPRRHLLGPDRQRLRRQGQLARRDALPQPLPHRLGQRHGRAPRDGVPARSRTRRCRSASPTRRPRSAT